MWRMSMNKLEIENDFIIKVINCFRYDKTINSKFYHIKSFVNRFFTHFPGKHQWPCFNNLFTQFLAFIIIRNPFQSQKFL